MSKPEIILPPDQAEREMIVQELSQNLLVEAGAGTGKTTCLVERMVALLASGACRHVSQLVAVTFTRKAAAELRARFRLRLEQKAREATGSEKENLSRALAELDLCFIGTIHSFCARLLRGRPVEAGIDVDFQELEEIADQRLQGEAWNQFVRELILSDPDQVLSSLERLGLNISHLQEAFSHFLQYPEVLEWPASSLPPEKIPGLVQTIQEIEDYAEHMRELEPRLPSEFRSDTLVPKYKIIPRILAHYQIRENVDQLVEVLDRFTKKGEVRKTLWRKKGNCTEEEAVAEEKKWLDFQQHKVLPLLNQIYESRYPTVLLALQKARAVYDRLRAEASALNYQDLLLKARDLLRDHRHVREYFSHRITHLLVDEFQDTDPIQAEVMLFLTSTDPGEKNWRKCVPRAGSLFVVGDPKQSIYRFRRADIVTYNQVKEIIKQHGKVIHLRTNFRASPQIISWLNQVFSPKEGGGTEGLLLFFPSKETPESPEFVPLEPGRQEKPGELSGLYSLSIPGEIKNNKAVAEYEAERIANFIAYAVGKMTVERGKGGGKTSEPSPAEYSDFLILTRQTFRLSIYAQKLMALGIPHQVTGGTALNELRELRWLAGCLRTIVYPDDPVALVGLLRSELFGFSDPALYHFKKAGGNFAYTSPVPSRLAEEKPEEAQAFEEAFSRLKKYSQWLERLPLISAVEKMMADLGLLVQASLGEAGADQAGGLVKAIALLRQIPTGNWTPARLVQYLEQLLDEKGKKEKHDGLSAQPEEKNCVRVMNLHKAKGLEAPVVFLADPGGEKDHDPLFHINREGEQIRGYLVVKGPADPHGHRPLLAQPPEWEKYQAIESRFQRAEELRLRYVAATRAGAALIISQWEGDKNSKNPWQYFQPFLETARPLPDPGPQKARKKKVGTITTEIVQTETKRIQQRLLAAKKPSYDMQEAKKFALSPGGVSGSEGVAEIAEEINIGPLEETEHGKNWGSALHLLLQVAMQEPGADLDRLARAALREYDVEAGLAKSAVQIVTDVMGSEIWQRARKSLRHFTEVPFQELLPDQEPPLLVHGTIDLIFQEKDGWVLMDYKTHRQPFSETLVRTYAPQIHFYAQAWERITGQKVKQRFLFFIHSGLLVSI